MDTRIGDLRCKEVINVTDGTRYGYVGDVEVDLETGRKNQIRVHMADMGHPIAGDRQYGARTRPLGRLCLHAHELTLTDPRTGGERTFSAKEPAAFRRLCRGGDKPQD